MQKLVVFICLLVLFSYLPIHVHADPLVNVVTNLRTSLTYSSIQDAIDDASAGDTLSVGAGTYNENVVVDIEVNIYGVSASTVTVDGGGSGIVFEITADYVNLSKLTITNNGGDGVYLNNADHGVITRNIFLHNNGTNAGIFFDHSSYWQIYENDFEDSSICLYNDDDSDYNLAYHNNFLNCSAIDDVPTPPSTNLWNLTYPNGGNYWYDHFDFTDDFSGPNQDILGSDGIVDTPYSCGRSGVDYYPSMTPIDYTSLPPILSDPSPVSGTTDISLTQSMVSVRIEDASNTFDYTIEGTYITAKSETGAHNGIKTTSIVSTLPYYTTVVWYVNATNGLKSVSAVYSFITIKFTAPVNNYVAPSYGPSDPQWRKTRWNDVQDAIDTIQTGGTIHISAGTYDVGIDKLDNLWINRSMTLQGENRDTTIIHGESMHGGVVDFTIEISDVKYPWGPISNTVNVFIKDLTIENEYISAQSACMQFRQTQNCKIDNCRVSGGFYGIVLEPDAYYTTISSCLVEDMENTGILGIGSYTTIEYSEIMNNQEGLALAGTIYEGNMWIIGNNIHDNSHNGVDIDFANNVTVIENTIEDNGDIGGSGCYVFHSRNVSIYHNNFISNRVQADDDGLNTNLKWNDTYPSGGNYWDDFDEPSEGAYDNYKGSAQSIPGIDGIVDENSMNPYTIPGGGNDWYPLIYPYSGGHCMGADFYWTPYYPSVNDTVTFSEDVCSMNVISWKWNFGDGTTKTATGSTTHIYKKAGYYDVTLTIEDKWGAKDHSTKRIYVGNMPHIPPIQPPKYPGYTVPEMYQLLRADKLDVTTNTVKIMVLDTGVTQREYNGINLKKITVEYNHAYPSGTDENGHGTWCAYAVAYLLQTKAPNAKQISYRMLDKAGGCTTQIFLDALDQAMKEGVDVVSISAGTDFGKPGDPLTKKCDELKRAGIIIIVAAGNKGPVSSSVASPGVSDSVITIGAEDPQWYVQDKLAGILNLKDDTIAYWSSRGPVGGMNYYKPDVVAPGESIWGPWLSEERKVSGTSMATPLVAAGVALIVAENRGLIDQAKQALFWDKSAISNAMEEALKESCYPKGDKNTWGAGIVQFDKVNILFKQKLSGMIFTGCASIIILLVILIIVILLYIYKKKKTKKWWAK